jgi:hypothetical protein
MKKLLLLFIMFSLSHINTSYGQIEEEQDIISCVYEKGQLKENSNILCPKTFDNARDDKRFGRDFSRHDRRAQTLRTQKIIDCKCTCKRPNTGWCGHTIETNPTDCQKTAKLYSPSCGMKCTMSNERYEPYHMH